MIARRGSWLRATLIVGVAYFAVGRGFTLPFDHVQAWRLAAWFVSAGVYAAHIWYEHSSLHTAPRHAALHVALGVAFGAFLLALAGMIRSLSVAPMIRPTWLLALVLWPAFTALPAFLGALVAAALLQRLSRRAA